jgi:hypothetical protein
MNAVRAALQYGPAYLDEIQKVVKANASLFTPYGHGGEEW